MEYSTNQKNITSSPRKLRLVADMIRKMSPYQAVETLQFTNKAAAIPLAKAIMTAIANAGKKENLAFKKLEINEGSKLKRYRPGTAGRGRGRPYKRRWSNIKVVLTDDVKSQEPRVKSQVKTKPTDSTSQAPLNDTENKTEKVEVKE